MNDESTLNADRPFKIEACVVNEWEAMLASKSGADQVELCTDLDNDGLFPGKERIKACLKSCQVHVKVMVRPRAGDFEYNTKEIMSMKDQIELCRDLGITEVVFGALTAGCLNMEVITDLAGFAFPMNVTVHKAIDLTGDPVAEAKKLTSLKNVVSILTSGGAPTALEGAARIKEMISATEGAIDIIPAGRIVPANLYLLHDLVGVRIYHGRNILGTIY